MRTLEDALKEKMKEPGFRAEYDALEPEFAIIQAMIDARKNSGFTQKQLSDMTGIDQSDISRIESGNANPSLKTLKRLASAMDKKLVISFIPIANETPNTVLGEKTVEYKR